MSEHSKNNDESLDVSQGNNESERIEYTFHNITESNDTLRTKRKLFSCVLIRIHRIYRRLRDRRDTAEMALAQTQRLLLVSLKKNRTLERELDELKDEEQS